MNDSLNLKGTLKITLSDSNGKVKEEHHFKNLIVDAGKSFVINALKASSTQPFDYIAIGEGTITPLGTQTALQTEIARNIFTYVATTASLTMTSVFLPGVGTGTITEAGIFNAASSGTMLSRTTFFAINKTATDQLTVVWTITLS
jgi:hypothetical protein